MFHGAPTQKPSIAPAASASEVIGGGTTTSFTSRVRIDAAGGQPVAEFVIVRGEGIGHAEGRQRLAARLHRRRAPLPGRWAFSSALAVAGKACRLAHASHKGASKA